MARRASHLLCCGALLISSAMSATPIDVAVAADCGAALEAACAAQRSNVISCAGCAGQHRQQLQQAGCDNDMISRWCAGLPVPPTGAVCATVAGVEGKLPHRYDETDAKDAGDCCASCGSDATRCRFWSFKASDVPNGNACRRFDAIPTQNQSSGAFVSGAAPPAAAHSSVRLRVSGDQLLDPSGSRVRLTGFNWPPKAIFGSSYSEDAALMRQQLPKANMVRMGESTSYPPCS